MTTSAESPPTDEAAPPALYGHCCNVYKAMLAEAKSVNVGGEEDEGEDLQIIVYEGFLTQLITSKLSLSVPYYTHTRKALMAMGCIRQLRRGGSTSPSQWELIFEPTLEAFMRQMPTKVPRQTHQAQTDANITNLSKRVTELETWQEAVNELLAEKFGSEES